MVRKVQQDMQVEQVAEAQDLQVQLTAVLMEEQEVQPKHQPLQAQLYTTLQAAAVVKLCMDR